MRSQGNAQMVDTAQASLLVRGGVNSGMIVSLSKRPITLGRRSDNDVVVDESTVSRRHALIMETPSGYAVRDLNTINGTFVNQRDIGQEECILKHGDTIRLAASEISYVFRQEGKHTVRIQVEPLPTGVITTGQRNVRQPPSVVDQEPKPAFNEKPEVALVGKESMLLEFLESKQGNVVSREDIHRQVWPDLSSGAHVDLVIDHAIERIRAQIGDGPQAPARLFAVGEFGFLLL